MTPDPGTANFLTGVPLYVGAVLVAPVSVAIHEAAHALAARLVGFRVLRVAVGGGEPLLRWRWRDTTFVLGRRLWFGGHVLGACEPGFAWRLRYVFICLAGPLASVAVAFGLFQVSRAHPHDWVGWIAFAFGLANVLGAMTLLPMRVALANNAETDGLQALTALTCSRAALEARIVAHLEAEVALTPNRGMALERARRLLPLAPRSAVAAYLVGGAKLDEGAWEEARDLLGIAVRSGRVPESVEGQLQNAFAWAALRAGGPYDEALVAARRAYELHPDSLAVVETLGEALTQSGRPEEGLPHLERAWTALPTEPAFDTPENRTFSATALARAHRLLGHTEEAERWEGIARTAK